VQPSRHALRPSARIVDIKSCPVVLSNDGINVVFLVPANWRPDQPLSEVDSHFCVCLPQFAVPVAHTTPSWPARICLPVRACSEHVIDVIKRQSVRPWTNRPGNDVRACRL
jgi:hypothetical protein